MSVWLINPTTKKWQIPSATNKWQIGTAGAACCCPPAGCSGWCGGGGVTSITCTVSSGGLSTIDGGNFTGANGTFTALPNPSSSSPGVCAFLVTYTGGGRSYEISVVINSNLSPPFIQAGVHDDTSGHGPARDAQDTSEALICAGTGYSWTNDVAFANYSLTVTPHH